MDWRSVIVNGVKCFVCEHGIEHPDKKTLLVQNGFDESKCADQLKHNCDGCCMRPDFPGFINLENFKK